MSHVNGWLRPEFEPRLKVENSLAKTGSRRKILARECYHFFFRSFFMEARMSPMEISGEIRENPANSTTHGMHGLQRKRLLESAESDVYSLTWTWTTCNNNHCGQP